MSDALLTLVAQRPARADEDDACPVCAGRLIRVTGQCTTLVGIESRNHICRWCVCEGCSAEFVIERRGEHKWYTDRRGKLLAGVPTCFEDYIYTCAECGEDVLRTHTEMDGATRATSLRSGYQDGNWTQWYRTFYQCRGCQRKIEYPNDYWKG